MQSNFIFLFTNAFPGGVVGAAAAGRPDAFSETAQRDRERDRAGIFESYADMAFISENICPHMD